MDDADLAYVALRNRQVHDLWHVLFSCPTTVCGELGLKALEFVQVQPVALCSPPIAVAMAPPPPEPHVNESMPVCFEPLHPHAEQLSTAGSAWLRLPE